MKRKSLQTTYANVCDSLRRRIISGDLKPGQRLKIFDLMRTYEVSSVPIREALQILQGEGLVVMEQHRGASVRQVNKTFVLNLFELRTALECMLIRSACIHITEKELKKLESIQAEHELAAEENVSATLVGINLKFHDLIYSLSDNFLAVEALNRYSSILRGLRAQIGYCPTRPAEIILEHRQIIEALRTKDPDKAESALKRHCQSAAADLLIQIDQRLPD